MLPSRLPSALASCILFFSEVFPRVCAVIPPRRYDCTASTQRSRAARMKAVQKLFRDVGLSATRFGRGADAVGVTALTLASRRS